VKRRRDLLEDQDGPLVWIDEPVSVAERIEAWLLRHPWAARLSGDALVVATIWGVLVAAWAAGSSL
jgi:hypothetical protein